MGLFDSYYNKVGPGVSKNEPEKRAFFKFFTYFKKQFFKVFTAGVWGLILTIFVIPCGLGQVGMTYSIRHSARNRQSFPTSDFFKGIKENWLQAFLVGFLNIIFTGAIIFYVGFARANSASLSGKIMLVIAFSIFMLFTFSKYYHYTLLSTFKMPIYKVYTTSIILGILGMKNNFIITVVLGAIYVLSYLIIVNFASFGLIVVAIFITVIFPGFRVFLIQYNTFNNVKKYVIDPYYNQHPDEDIEKRKLLGLIEQDEFCQENIDNLEVQAEPDKN